MRAMGGGRPKDERPDLDLDLDLRERGDAQVQALFREGLGAHRGQRPELRAIERRARQRHRRFQVAVSGAVAAVAVLAAVLVVVSPELAHGGSEVVPSVPKPSATPTGSLRTPERVTRSSLLRAPDLRLSPDQTGLGPGGRTFQAQVPAENLSDAPVVDRFCGGPALSADPASAGWTQRWDSTEDKSSPDYSVNEQVLQWPGQPDQASAVFDQMRSQEYCANAYGNARSSTTETVAGDPNTSVPVLVRHVVDGDGRQKGQALVVWDDVVVMIDLVGPGAADRSGGGESAGEVAVNLLGVAVDRLAGANTEGSSPQWSAPMLSTDVPTRTGDGP